MTRKTRIAGIVQARMGSTRLPRKVLKPIMDKPMLWFLIKRLEKSKYIDDIVIATTKDKLDDSIEEFAHDFNYNIYRGSLNDIVDRFYNAAITYKADIIVRIWGDCPLIDPEIIDKGIKNFINFKAEYGNNFNPQTFPAGLSFEIYSISTLKRILKSTNDLFYREFPVEYIYANPNLFKTIFVTNDENLSDIDLTVDYIQDFKLIEIIFKNLYNKNSVFSMEDVLNLMEQLPELKEMNKGLARNIEYKEKKRKESC